MHEQKGKSKPKLKEIEEWKKKQEPEGKMASAETGTKLEFEQVEEQDMRQSNETGNGTNRGQ